MKFFSRIITLFIALTATVNASAIGWPADYQGVMLQGFYWDSYSDTKWTKLESQADELSKYFSLIWIPNSGNCGGGNNMGYMPIYWFTNHNSSFGTEAELLKMIKTFKEKGTGFIADCVINHRNGKTNWTDFPDEEWNGKTWHIGPEGICCNDEVANAAGQAKPTGNYDTGDNFDGCRDLDHTNANVQDNCKNYIKCLQEKYGYVGMRYDMVKGYSGEYTGIYNRYSNVKFSVGEYWDSNYDAVARWINATGKTSAAFDFPCKYAINEAFSSNDMTKLVWKANGTTDQPAGMIHYGYSQYSVTFVDNHDTYRDGSKFTSTGNIVAANAFILMSPGTPCVFLRHYLDNKQAIAQLVKIRNSVGIHNNSAVNVIKSSRDCYMAEVTGKNGKAVVKIGSSMDNPNSLGYSDRDIKASGTNYCVWTKVAISDDRPDNGDDNNNDDPVTNKEGVTVYFDNSVAKWASVKVHYWGNEDPTWNSTWPGVDMKRVGSSDLWMYTCPVGTIGTVFNDGTGNQSSDCNAAHTYVYDHEGNSRSAMPSKLYVIGNLKEGSWNTSVGIEMKKDNDRFVARSVELVTPPADIMSRADGEAYFSFASQLSGVEGDWDTVNSGYRFGPADESTNGSEMMHNKPGEQAGSTQAWHIAPGIYDITANFGTNTMTIAKHSDSSISTVTAGSDMTPVYYNLQGLKVTQPTPGNIYIVVRGSRVAKEVFRAF